MQKEGFSIQISGNFDETTASAVVGFQEKYSSEILKPFGLSRGTGFVGKSTRAKLNNLYGCGTIKPSTPFITILSPKGGEQLVSGLKYEIKWDKGFPYESHCMNSLSLIDRNGNIVGSIGMLEKGQTSFIWDAKTLYSSSCGTSNYRFTVSPGEYRIKLVGTNTYSVGQGVIAYSDYFTITSSTQPYITVLSPNGREVFTRGSTMNIRWEPGNAKSSTVLLEIRKGNSQYVMITSSAPNTGSYNWTIPSTFATGNDYKIRVTDYNNRTIFDESDMPFSIM